MNGTVTALGAHWRQAGSCADPGIDPDLFFGPDLFDENPEPRKALFARIRKARAICAPCPIRGLCLELAVRNRESGIWAGTTEDERRSVERPAGVTRARSPIRECRKGLHLLEGANVGFEGRCLACKREQRIAAEELEAAS